MENMLSFLDFDCSMQAMPFQPTEGPDMTALFVSLSACGHEEDGQEEDGSSTYDSKRGSFTNLVVVSLFIMLRHPFGVISSLNLQDLALTIRRARNCARAPIPAPMALSTDVWLT